MVDAVLHAPARSYRLAVALVVGMFAMWGLAHRLYDTLLPEFATALSLDVFQTSLAQWILSFGYWVMAIPAAMLTRNFGYKSGLVFGLGLYAVGMFLFYPAADRHEYYFLLSAALVAGCGLTALEVAADPLIVRLGARETAVRRLNIAQALNPIGVVLGFFVGRWVLQNALHHPVAQLADAMVTPYLLIGGVVLFCAFIVENVDFPPVARERVAKDDRTVTDFKKLFPRRIYMLGAGALFLCSVTQVVMWGFTMRYAQAEFRGLSTSEAADVLLWALFAFTAGRVFSTGLMFRFDPSLVLAAFASLGSACMVVAAVMGGHLGIWSIVAASFFLSVVFPTIFGNSIRDLGPQTKSGAAFLMLCAGTGAIVLALANLVVGPATVQYVMVIPALGFGLIAAYALIFHRRDELRT